ncbi:adapter protein MecA [Virgibacillus pantothenticus]|uniref:Adapter protein MecA n=1 Tax=Virgibacillus pantothenticus TaxID=1473 RepID=A0A0L0QU53_VIRPA|nr:MULTISPECIES: adaptor protein MecA [Virgibacillus]API91014.1 adaptor protein MecA [Virgibacillus sp. 6R]KNE22027.1 adapter protein MecA [Virgibacillus pantothenticus]MBS7428999.1 adaptor protein MecA [Virgibacillus sp. 19R1-5]MBU8566752.1 adaptor protein MecA [Virgibacillus pantothenticus]MBU8600335.1 adaptor protein MecA [Virgibacillus pantothenticus]
MEIERINENTVKFYISYMDIEDRGFEREEIWYNRERSEQLFWQMMDEVNYKEDFNVDGPLWIQVQALEKGLEIIVTKAQISKNGDSIELQTDDGNTVDFPVDKKIENMLEDRFGKEDDEEVSEPDSDENLWIIVSFKDFEDVIQLSHYFTNDDVGTIETLYHYNDIYYLYMEFSEEDLEEEEQENMISKVFEFGNDTDITIHVLSEYGKIIFDRNTFSEVRSHFPANI